MQSSTSSQPLVSIVMLTYNRATLLKIAIDSVLSQTYSNWELLILDDASTDNTEEVVARYTQNDARIKYLPTPTNLGITKNRNRAFGYANGKYMAVLDSDDLWIDVKKLAKQVAFLESQLDYVLVGTMVKVINSVGDTLNHFRYSITDKEIRRKILLRNQFTHSAVLWRRNKDNKLDYDESLPTWEDYDLILRLGKIGKLANLDKEMTAYRIHKNNASKSVKKIGVRTHLDIIKRYRFYYPNYFIAKLKGLLRYLK